MECSKTRHERTIIHAKERPLILFQCPNQIGLGHMSRLAAIALSIRDRVPQMRLPFLVEGASHSLLESYNLPYLSLPGARDLRQYWTAWHAEELQQLTSSICLALIKNLRPDVIVFDCLPNAAIIAAAAECEVPMVLCLRKIKNFDHYCEQMADTFAQMERILIPHESGDFEIPSAIQTKSVFVGQIVRPDVEFHAMPTRSSINKDVVITGGGGGYPNTVCFYNLAIRALSTIQEADPTVRATLLTGPLFNDWGHLQLRAGIKVCPFTPDMISLFARSTLVIAQAGYNTVAELRQLGVRGILVPAERAFDDQFERAQTAAIHCPNLRVFRGDHEQDLSRLIKQCLKNARSLQQRNADSGASKAADELLALLAR